MFNFVPLMLAVALPDLQILYWICLIVGGGLLIISSVGAGDADVDIDVDMDVDLDLDVDAAPEFDAELGHAHAHPTSLASWFSLQFVVFFIAMFGVVGVTLTHLSDQTGGVVLIAALIGGLIVGQGVHQALRKIRRTSGDSTPKEEDYANKLARVTVAVAGSRKGEIAMRVGRSDRYVPAVARRTDQSFNPGDSVGVVAYRDGVAEIVSREEYEFTTETH